MRCMVSLRRGTWKWSTATGLTLKDDANNINIQMTIYNKAVKNKTCNEIKYGDFFFMEKLLCGVIDAGN